MEENLELAQIAPPKGWSIKRIYDLFPRLGERRRQEGTTLSGVASRVRPIALRQVSPGGAGAEHPHDAVEHAPIIHTGDAARLVRQQRFDHAPFEVGQVVAVQRWAPTLWELES